MDLKDFKSLILNAIEKEPDVKSKIIKRITMHFYPGYPSSNWISLSNMAQTAMQQLIDDKIVKFTPKEPLIIIKRRKYDL